MTRIGVLALICAGIAPISQRAYADTQIPVAQCEKLRGALAFHHCRYPGDARSDKVIYYFHSVLTGPKEWGRVSGPFYAWLDSHGVPRPEVLAISFGPEWFLSENTTGQSSGRLRYLVEKAIPTLEKSIGIGLRPIKRFAIGVSMGGFNAAQVYLRHSNLWDAVALACPALSVVNPHAYLEEIQTYASRTGAKLGWLIFALWRSRAHFPTAESWEEASPFTGSRQLVGPHLPRVFLYGGDHDRFGFQEGAERFARQLEAAGVLVEASSRAGDHCPNHAGDIARFLFSETH